MDGEDELIESSRYNEIRRKYEQYMSLTSCEVFRLDTTDRKLEDQVNKICNFIRE
jgi:hypothetical protein